MRLEGSLVPVDHLKSNLGDDRHFFNKIHARQLKLDGLYQDYVTSGLNIRTQGAAAATLTNWYQGIWLNAFAGSGGQAVNEGYFSVHILHDLKAGSVPTFHVHWTNNTADPKSGNVKWNIDVTAARGYSADIFPAVATMSSVQAVGVQYDHTITPDGDMPLPAAVLSVLEPDVLLLCRIYRDHSDVADTFSGNAFLIQADIHYPVGQVGTISRNRPYTEEGF